MLIGRTHEVAKLREAILARRSLLVYGVAGAGKTALLDEALSGLASAVRDNCIVCDSCESPQAMWRHLIRSLAARNDPQVLSRVQRECAATDSLDRWLDKQSSLRLRGILRRAMRAGAYFVFLDATAPLPAGVYRLLQEWIWSGRTPVFLLARGSAEQDLGRVARLYWHSGLQLELGPLRPEHLKLLLEDCIARFHLKKLADEKFRDFILKQCAGLPGRVVRLCQLASQTTYQYEGRLKLHTLAVDFLLQNKSGSPAPLRAGQHG